jgi:signal transduction histidine kinase
MAGISKSAAAKTPPPFPRVADLPLILFLALIYFAAGKFGLSLAFSNASATAVWPPTGLSLAAILLLGYRVTPAIFLGAFFVNWTTAGGIATSAGIALGNTLEAVAGAFLIRRFALGVNFPEHAVSVFKFFVLAGISALLSAAIGTFTLLAGSLVRPVDFFAVGFTWWVGDFVSAVILTPLIILWTRLPRGHWRLESALEILVLLICICGISGIVFGGGFNPEGTTYPLEYLGIPFLLWAAFRFGGHGATGVSFLISGIALYQTLRGRGPFAVINPNDSLLLLQSFMAVSSALSLVVAAVLLDQKRFQEERSHFVSAVSHELRTPLGVIKGGLDVIVQGFAGPVSAKQKEFLEVALKNVDRLTRLVNDILDFQRLQAKAFPLNLEDCNPSEILEETGKMAHFMAGQKGITFSMEIENALPKIPADKDRLIQVLFNVLDNAIKFTDKGSVSLAAQKRPMGIQILVTDTGPGIRPEDREKIFKPFGQIRSVKGGGKNRGTGLGLVISRKIIEQHGGRLDLESQTGKGTRVVIFLPER